MMNAVSCAWTGGMAFDADVGGHTLQMDAGAAAGGHDEGPEPKPLLLAALAGCTGMDVVSLLGKMRVAVDGFEVEVEGDLSEEHPRTYVAMRLAYRFRGKGLDEAKIARAVELSQTRYCGVSALLRKALPLTYRIIYTDG